MASGKYKVVGPHTVNGVEPGGVVDLSEMTVGQVHDLVFGGHVELEPEQEAAEAAAPVPSVEQTPVDEAPAESETGAEPTKEG